MISRTLSDWFESIKSLHTKFMDLGLDRVQAVAKKMSLLNPARIVVTVGGTNGKGSTVAGLEAIYREAGFKVGAFTSPFLFRFNEQIRISGKDVSDQSICLAFEKIENARGNITLTPFEFNTLAALEIFRDADLDICILEVGLGGRLDAVNIIDPDVAIVASIDIDHTEWLGDTREKIAHEKAGIFRANKPAICGDFNPPQSIFEDAKKIGATLYCQNREFGFETDGFFWHWWSQKKRLENLPQPKLLLENMACVLMAVELLQTKLPVTPVSISTALKTVTLRGRLQQIPGKIPQIYDVSHNPASVAQLAEFLRKNKIAGKTRAVFSMLADKDILSTLQLITEHIDYWYVAPLNTERAASKETLIKLLQQANIKNINWYLSIKEAHVAAMNDATEIDRVVIFGSFHTVAEALTD